MQHLPCLLESYVLEGSTDERTKDHKEFWAGMVIKESPATNDGDTDVSICATA